ncbi:MAG TPA: hypothetical protein VLX29_09490 [Nitrospirota bacterium]|nr:hypothetical protein [Nitrospirota bacterium]
MKPFTFIAAIVFGCIAVFHLVRIASHWQVSINGVIIPQWLSIPGCLVTGFLSCMLLYEARKR